MKKLTGAVLFLTLFAISCQMKSESIEANSVREINKTSSIQTETLPTSKSNPQDINLKIGIVDGHIEKICFRTKNGNLAENTAISIVTSLDETPQKILSAKVGKKLKTSCSRRASESTDQNPGQNFYYLLTLIDKEVDEFQEVFGFGLIEPETPLLVQNELASIDLNNDGKFEFFRTCYGFEGVLFAIWTEKPLKGKQIWHSFYYVDYATVPNCKKEDSNVTDD